MTDYSDPEEMAYQRHQDRIDADQEAHAPLCGHQLGNRYCDLPEDHEDPRHTADGEDLCQCP